jgi:hypothetical protein
MDQGGMVAALAGDRVELEGIVSRFARTRDSIHIQSEDDRRFREIALELRDLFDDEFVDGHRHSKPLAFSDAVSNWTGSASLAGVENVKGVAAAGAKRAFVCATPV